MWSGTQLTQQVYSHLNLHSTTAYVSGLLAACTGKPLDYAYSRVGGLTGSFFQHGWGNLGVVNFEEDVKYMKTWPPQLLKINWKLKEEGRSGGQAYQLYHGTFRTPCTGRIWDALPPECRVAHVQLLVPPSPTRTDSCLVHLAATGDQGFSRRLRMAMPLLRQGVGSLVLESPFYGLRRPEAQVGSKLRHVSDLLLLGWGTICETLHLLHWAAHNDFERKGITGLSMGGVHACMTAGLYPQDVACTPLLAPRSAAVAYCDGALKYVTAWEALLAQHDAKQKDVVAVARQAAQAIHVMRAAQKALEVLEQHNPIQENASSPTLPSDSAPRGAASQSEPSFMPASSSRPTSPHPTSSHSFSTVSTSTPSNSFRPDSSPPSTQPHETTAAASGGCLDTEAPASSATTGDSSETSWQYSATHVSSSTNSQPPPHHSATPNSSTSSATSSTTLPWQAVLPSDVSWLWGSRADSSGSAPRPSSSEQQQMQREVAEALHDLDRGADPRGALLRLKGVLETFTDITRYPCPRRPDAAILVAAEHDGYVSLESVEEVHKYWEGSELRRVPGGHVSAFLLQQAEFRRAQMDSLNRLQQ